MSESTEKECTCTNCYFDAEVQRRRAAKLNEEVSAVLDRLQRAHELQAQAERQAARSINRLANVVETVRARADAMQRAGMHDYAAVLRGMATELQKMELP
jgi:L-lactate utilization protein LutB